MKSAIILALVLLPALAWPQTDGTGECMVDGGKTQIAGKLRVVVDSHSHRITITGYVVDLIKPRCYVKISYHDSGLPVREQKTATVSVDTIQIYFNESDLPPELDKLTRDAPDEKVRWARLEKWLKVRLGKDVLVAGSIGSTALSPYAFTDPILKIDAISTCETSSKTKAGIRC